MKKNIIILLSILVSFSIAHFMIKPAEKASVKNSIQLVKENENNIDENTAKKIEVQRYSYIFKESINLAGSMNIQNKDLETMVVKLIAKRKIENENMKINKTELLKEAERELTNLNSFLLVARQSYNIKISDDDIKNHLENGTKGSFNDSFLYGYAQAMGTTTRDLIFHYDRASFEKELTIKKLMPKLREKYNSLDDSVVIKKYYDEVNNFIVNNS
jgi:hypothetical protein